jgi:hypothetical protein
MSPYLLEWGISEAKMYSDMIKLRVNFRKIIDALSYLDVNSR